MNQTATIEATEETVGRLRIRRSNLSDGRPTVIIHRGKARKPISNFSFPNDTARENHIQNRIDSDAAATKFSEERKAARKARYEEMKASVKVGSVFGTCWGYDQTNREWYQVVAIKGATLTLRELAQERRPDGSSDAMAMTDYVRCVPDKFIGDEIIRRLTADGVKISRSAYGTLEDDFIKYHYVSSYA